MTKAEKYCSNNTERAMTTAETLSRLEIHIYNLCRARHLLGAVRRWVQNRHHQPVTVRDPRLSALRGQSTSSAVHWISADQPEAQEERDHHRTHTHPLPPGVTPGVAGGAAADAPAGRECLEPLTCPQGRVDLGCPVQPAYKTRPREADVY